MTEIEQIRKELNELRERVACLEKRPVTVPVDLSRYFGKPVPSAGSPLADAWKYPSTPLWLDQNQEKGVV